MKKIFLSILVISAFCSCDKMDEPKQTGDVNDSDMWVVPDMAQGVLMKAYNAISRVPDSYDGNFLDAATDNAVTNSFTSSVYKLSKGRVTSFSNPLDPWKTCYDQFQNIHLFLEKGLTDTTKYSTDSAEKDVEIKDRLRGEAYYLRAWWGFYLLQHYGGKTADGRALGYPIVLEFVTEEKASDFSWIKRDTYEDCVKQICTDCDEAVKLLPETIPAEDVGRAYDLMAEFLKARVLLYAASPAYQPDEIVKITSVGKYVVTDTDAYTEKWERAANQLWKVLNMPGVGPYKALKRTELVDLNDKKPTAASHFVMRYFLNHNDMEKRHFPPYYFGSCNTAPSQNLVDAYPMKTNGYPIDHENSGYDEDNPYNDRDNRLKLTVFHQGSKFGENDSYIDVVYGGKDSESFVSSGNMSSRTGYYLSKFMSFKKDMLNPVQSVKSIHYYAPMRTAELFLSFAEASNEVWGPESIGPGMDKSAYDIIKEIRKKSGGIVKDLYIDEVKGSKDDFRQLILNERRLEFAFENFRFWDLRRCLMPLNEPIRKVVVQRDEKGNLKYDTTTVLEERELNDIKYYYLPIPYAEMKKNPDGMINNYGY